MKRDHSAVAVIVKVWLVAGTLDIADALIFNAARGISPVIVLRHIAAGLIGLRAANSGVAMPALGLALHYLIALIWTAVFYAASRRLSILYRHAVLCGLLYGIIVYVLMNWVVLPLSALPPMKRPVALASRVNGVLAVMFCIGLTISLLTRRFAGPPSTQ